MQSTRYCLFLNGAKESLFEGEYQGYGTVACAKLDPETIVFAPNEFFIGTENFTFEYQNWSKLVNDGFVPQLGRIKIIGGIGTDRADDYKKKAYISSNFYIRM